MWNQYDNQGNIIKWQSKNRMGRMLPIAVFQPVRVRSSKFLTRLDHQAGGNFLDNYTSALNRRDSLYCTHGVFSSRGVRTNQEEKGGSKEGYDRMAVS